MHNYSPVKMCRQPASLPSTGHHSSSLLYTGVPEEPPSRQKDVVLAAYFFCYVACYYKSF